MKARLETRCFLSSMLAHGLLVVALLVAAGFQRSRTELLDSGLPLELVPGELIDAALAAGPPPAGGVEPQVSPTPPEPKPQPVETPPTPRQEPRPAPQAIPPPKAESDIKFDIPKTDGPGFVLPSSRIEEKPKPKPAVRERPKIDLSKATTLKEKNPRSAEKTEPRVSASPEESARARTRALDRSLASAAGSLAATAGRSTIEVQISGAGGGGGGGGGGGRPNNAQYIRNAYNQAWTTPYNVADERATVEVDVVLRQDGTVVSSRIAESSGIAALDRSVEEALKRVVQIRPFEPFSSPDPIKISIGFNLRSKRNLQ